MRTGLIVMASLVLTACTHNSREANRGAINEAAPGGSVERKDQRIEALVPQNAAIERIATGFQFTEGPLWFPAGHLWFSDVQGNVVRQWSPNGVTEILRPGGFDGTGAPDGAFIGPNGMIADKNGGVLLCQHGNRRIARIAPDRTTTTLIDRFEGKRLNSPNDLVYRSDGSLYFTDPPYGLAGGDEDAAKELKFNGVYRLKNGKLQLLIEDLTRPNGIAFSPDEKVLYVANSDPQRKIWMRYDVRPDGTVGHGKVFADVTSETEDGLPDGMKVDANGNVYATGPGGVWIFSPEGTHLGTIKPAETPANCNWGGDGRTLYMTARTSVYRITLAVQGRKPFY
jgi:gluconolactonase